MVTESQARMDEYIEGRRLNQKAIIKEITEEKNKEIERLKKENATLSDECIRYTLEIERLRNEIYNHERALEAPKEGE